MKDHQSNERVGMIVAAAVAAVSITAFVLFDFALGARAPRSGLSMTSAAAIERAGASAILTETMIFRPQEAQSSGQ
jgi:hypothetical protein